MLDINVRQDERLGENVEKIISGMLPHRNYDSQLFSELYLQLTRVIQEDEFTGEYYIIIRTFSELSKIGNMVPDYKAMLTKDNLNSILNANIYDLVRKPEVETQSILREEGVDVNLDTEQGLTDAVNVVYTKVMDLYERCYNLAENSNSCFGYIVSLKSELVNHVMERSVKNQVHILRDSYRIGRRVYAGANDCAEYMSMVTSELQQRLDSSHDGVTIIDDISKVQEMNAALEESMEKLADCGVPPIDEQTPMMTHWYRVLCAPEGTGKTMFAINSAVNLLLAGKRVVFMSGESDEPRLFAKITSNYIFKKYKKYVDYSMVQNPKNYDIPADILKLIRLAQAEIAELKGLIYQETFTYDRMYSELKSLYERYRMDAVIIDHTLALTGGSHLSEKERIDRMSNDIRRFKKEYPVFFLVLSHMSSNGTDDLRNDVRVKDSPTRGSSMPSKDADDIYIMYANEALANKGLVQIQNYKRREASLIYKYMYIKSRFEVCSFDWDDELQGAGDMEISDARMEEMIDDINGVKDDNLLDEYDDYDEDFDDDFDDYDDEDY